MQALEKHDAEIREKLHGGTLNLIEHMSPYASIIAEEKFDIVNPVVENAPVKFNLHLLLAGLVVIPNKVCLFLFFLATGSMKSYLYHCV